MPFTRRKFLGGLTALIGGLALEEAIPFNRVWSFPTKIVVPNIAPLATIYYDPEALWTFKYAYRNSKTGKLSDPILVTGMEAQITRNLIGTERRFDHLGVVAVPIE